MQAFKLAVGRSYRLVDRLDVVPALPPFDGYVHLDFSQWIQVPAPACFNAFVPVARMHAHVVHQRITHGEEEGCHLWRS